jgi:PhoPQ-activated pathogenicity-related protein
MTKAVKLAMDVATEVAAQKGKTLDKFVVAGASKRGWTTWTTAAVDDRVVAFVPIVIDLLNIQPSFQHHWRNYGFWAPAVEDYEREGIMDWQGSAEYERLLEITEPYSFLEAYANKPKLLINAAGDQFFLRTVGSSIGIASPGKSTCNTSPTLDMIFGSLTRYQT